MKFNEAAREKGLNEESRDRLASKFSTIFPGNETIDTMLAGLLDHMDPNLLPEVTHCIDVATTIQDVLKHIIADSSRRRELGFSRLSQHYEVEAAGLLLAGLFHDIALGYDREELSDITGQRPLHRWDKNDGILGHTDDYRGGILLDNVFGNKTGLPDAAVDHAIEILQRDGAFEQPWQSLLKFSDAIPYLNGDNDARALIETYMLGDHIDSFKKGTIDVERLQQEVDFWLEEGFHGLIPNLASRRVWHEREAEQRMRKKGVLAYSYIRDSLPEIHNAIVKEAMKKQRAGLVGPDTWAVRNYHAAVKVLADNNGLPADVAKKMTEMYGIARSFSGLYTPGDVPAMTRRSVIR